MVGGDDGLVKQSLYREDQSSGIDSRLEIGTNQKQKYTTRTTPLWPACLPFSPTRTSYEFRPDLLACLFFRLELEIAQKKRLDRRLDWSRKKLTEKKGVGGLIWNQTHNACATLNTKEYRSLPGEEMSLRVVWEPLAHYGLGRQRVEKWSWCMVESDDRLVRARRTRYDRFGSCRFRTRTTIESDNIRWKQIIKKRPELKNPSMSCLPVFFPDSNYKFHKKKVGLKLKLNLKVGLKVGLKP